MPDSDKYASVRGKKVILVDENDQVLGETDVLDAHRGQGKLHRASSVFLFRKSPQNPQVIELLIQQRSDAKIVGAGQWANTVCGNVRPGESYLECAVRRLREELGIDISEKNLQPVEKFRYQVNCNEEFSENEMDQVFVGWWDGTVNENPAEVRQTQWVAWETVKNWQEAEASPQDKDLAPWFRIMLRVMLDRASLVEKIEKFIYEK